MTDYTQMTEQELADALAEIDSIQAEVSRRDWIKSAPVSIWTTLRMAPDRGVGKVETLLAGIDMTPRIYEPWVEFGPEGDVPLFTDEELGEIITALQARIDAV